MKIQTSKEKTNHILVAITPYSPNGYEDEFLDFGFAYFNLAEGIKQEVKEFLLNWKIGNQRTNKFPIAVSEITLLEGATIENADNTDKKEYEYIKFDSLSYLTETPLLDATDKYYKIQGCLICSPDFFNVGIERIPDGLHFPTIIYRSARFLYEKIL